jgi:sialic acid synthase SpsE
MKTHTFKIGDIEVGYGVRPLVIPEIGINHGGSLEVAKQMVRSAHRAGARLIKHQTHIVEDEMSGDAKRIKPGNADISIYEIMDSCALTVDEERELYRFTKELGLEYLSTPFSRAAADVLNDIGVAAYKIGSGEMNNFPLLRHIAAFGKPVILSTGMNDIDEVDKAVEILRDSGVPFALLHTTNLYPTPVSLVRLGAMRQMMERYPDVPVGLSDHTLNNNAVIAAIALGAAIVERHYTDTMDRTGPDIVCSMDERHLEELLYAAEQIPHMLGGDKTPIPEEDVTRRFAYASVVTIADIKAGEEFTYDNIWVKRPGTGEILAENFEKLLGKRAAVDIKDDTQLKRSMIK